MSYSIDIRVSNGYRCSCCERSWDLDTLWVDSLEEALLYVPLDLADNDKIPFNGDSEVVEVTVIDGATGEREAWGITLWSSGYWKYSGYEFACWRGWRPDAGSFQQVYSGRNKIEGKTWDQVKTEMTQRRAKLELEKAESDLKDAEERARRAREVLGEGQ